MPRKKTRKIGRPIFLRYRVTSIERHKDDDGGTVVCTRLVYRRKNWISAKNLGHIVIEMDTNLPEIGDIVVATFNWKKGKLNYGA